MSKNNPILSSIEIKSNLEEMGLVEISLSIVRRGSFDPRPTTKTLVSIKKCENPILTCLGSHSLGHRTVWTSGF